MATAAVLLCSAVAFAQSPADSPSTSPPADGTTAIDASTVVEPGATEWMVTAGPAWGIVVFRSSRNHRYMIQTVSWGRILAAPRGPGGLRGRFEWAVEVAPIYRQYEPSDTNGLAITPLVWRWNFEPRGRLAPYGELAGGGLWTRDPVPDKTTTANFTAHAAVGLRVFLRQREAAVVSYRFHHISNGNRIKQNPGVNAHMIQVGWVFARAHK